MTGCKRRLPNAQALVPRSFACGNAGGKDVERLIQAAVSRLPAGRQEIYRLSREEGLSHREIADRLGIALPTVKNQLGASLKFIYQQLHDKTGLPLALLMALFLL